MEDERAIEKMLMRYARGVDRRQLDLVRSCYWDDAHDDHEGFSGGTKEFCRWLGDVLPDVDVSTHQFTNVEVDVAGVDDSDPTGTRRASSSAYCLNTSVWRLDGGRERHLLTCLSYVDDWECRDGEWRLSNRVCRRLWSRVEEVDPW